MCARAVDFLHFIWKTVVKTKLVMAVIVLLVLP